MIRVTGANNLKEEVNLGGGHFEPLPGSPEVVCSFLEHSAQLMCFHPNPGDPDKNISVS